ncbi:MAG: hypothetical protein ABIW81_08595 [Terrimesophilobacter sp.]
MEISSVGDIFWHRQPGVAYARGEIENDNFVKCGRKRIDLVSHKIGVTRVIWIFAG